MVRARVVKHPEQWDWCGYRELAGARERYRLIDQDRLREAPGDGVDEKSFRQAHAEGIAEALRRGELARQEMWTHGLAVGSQTFVETVRATLKNTRRTGIAESEGRTAWVLQETGSEEDVEVFSGAEKGL